MNAFRKFIDGRWTTVAAITLGLASFAADRRALSAVSFADLRHCAAGQCSDCQFVAQNCKEIPCAWSGQFAGAVQATYTKGSPTITQVPVCGGLTGYSVCNASGTAFCTQLIQYFGCTACVQNGTCDCSKCDPSRTQTQTPPFTVADTCNVCNACK